MNRRQMLRMGAGALIAPVAMLFDFVLKRSLRSGGHAIGNTILSTRSRFDSGQAGT
jgi:hypothetical protein